MGNSTTVVMNIKQFINRVFLEELGSIVPHYHYLSFVIMASAIEFMGACLDAEPFDEPHLSRKRFDAAIRSLFDARYHKYAGKKAEISLYTNLRCGMVHVTRPGGKVVFTHKKESAAEGTAHLELLENTGQLVLVCEDLYDDFVKALENLKIKMGKRDAPKQLSDGYLVISGKRACSKTGSNSTLTCGTSGSPTL